MAPFKKDKTELLRRLDCSFYFLTSHVISTSGLLFTAAGDPAVEAPVMKLTFHLGVKKLDHAAKLCFWFSVLGFI